MTGDIDDGTAGAPGHRGGGTARRPSPPPVPATRGRRRRPGRRRSARGRRPTPPAPRPVQLSEGLAQIRTVERHLDEILAAVPAAGPDRARRPRRAGPALRRGGRQPAGAARLRPGRARRLRRPRRGRRRRATAEAPVELAVVGESVAGAERAVLHRPGPGAQGGRRRDAAGRRRRRRPGRLDRPGHRAGRRARRPAGRQLRPPHRGRRRARRPRRPGRHADRPGADQPAGRGRPRAGARAARGRGSPSSAPAPSWSTSARRPAPGQVVDVNSYALAAAARDAGAEAYRSGILPSDKRRLTEVLESQLLRSDLVLIAGTFASGGFDMVQEALAELGEMRFRQVTMHPGPGAGLRPAGPRRRSRSSASPASRWRRWSPSRCSSARRSG